MRSGMQCTNISNDLAAHIHTSFTSSSNGLFISTNAIFNWCTIYNTPGTIFLYDYISRVTLLLLLSLLQRVQKNDLGDVVVLDADNNTIESPFQDLESLPNDVVSFFFIFIIFLLDINFIYLFKINR